MVPASRDRSLQARRSRPDAVTLLRRGFSILAVMSLPALLLAMCLPKSPQITWIELILGGTVLIGGMVGLPDSLAEIKRAWQPKGELEDEHASRAHEGGSESLIR